MTQAVQASDRHLRVAMLWNGTLHKEVVLREPAHVTLGVAPSAMFPLPEGVIAEASFTLLSPSGLGYACMPHASLGGFMWQAGERKSVHQLPSEGARLGPDDYGVVTFGQVSVFFQHVRPLQLLAPVAKRDPALLASLSLSLFLHVVAGLFFALVAAKEFAQPDDLELDADSGRRFIVVQPPEDELAKRRKAGTETDDPGLRDRDEMGGKKHEREEGRVGRKDATREQTEIAGEPKDVVAAKVRGMGLLGVLAGGGPSNALSSALDTPSLDKMLGGLGAAQTVVGRGSGGMGLRGVGTGGGGTGQGTLFGAGELGTGVGAGSGSGRGRGAGGVGLPGPKAR